MREIALLLVAGAPLGTRNLEGIAQRTECNDRPGHQCEDEDGEVEPGPLVVLVAVACEALQVLLKQKEFEEVRVVELDGDVPRQHKHQVQDEAGNPDHAAQHLPFAPQADEHEDDAERHQGCNRTLGQCGERAEEVEIEEPELLAGFIPGVPAEHADGKGSGELHVGRGTARESNDGGCGGGDEGGIQVAARPKAPHVQKDEEHHAERAGGGRQARNPVLNAELLEKAHGAPVIERRLFQPGVAVQDRRNGAGLGAVPGRAKIFPVQRARVDLRIAVRDAAVMVGQQHLVGDLGVARFVGTNQADIRRGQDGVADAQRHQTVKQEQRRHQAEHDQLAKGGGSSVEDGAAQQIRPRRFCLVGCRIGLVVGAHGGAEAEANRLARRTRCCRLPSETQAGSGRQHPRPRPRQFGQQ